MKKLFLSGFLGIAFFGAAQNVQLGTTIPGGTTNVAVGTTALNQTLGNDNVGVGFQALQWTNGLQNTAVGSEALSQWPSSVEVFSGNIGVGHEAGQYVSGNNNIFLGNRAGHSITGNGNVILGRPGLATTPLNRTVIFATATNGAVNGDERMRIDSLGNAGIGTTAPKNKLDIEGSLAVGALYSGATASGASNSIIVQNRIGIANTNPRNRLEITHGSNNSSGLMFTNLTSAYAPAASLKSGKFLTVDNLGNVVLMNINTTPPGTDSNTNIYNTDGEIDVTPNNIRTVSMAENDLYFKATDSLNYGRVYIGKHISETSYDVQDGLDADYRLFVEKGILTEKVKVALRNTSNWADYVFDESYELRPLAEVEKFVKENKHLPGVASAKELTQKGLDLGAMQAKQMEKIEELTLYVIEQEKRLEKQNDRLEQQEQDIRELKEQILLLTTKN